MDSSVKDEKPKSDGRGLGRRHLQLVLLFAGLAASYSQRVTLSVCIVEMTSPSNHMGFAVYDWNHIQRGVVLSSFFWGYALMQLPAGMLVHHFGPRILLLIGVSLSGVLSILLPLVAHGGWQLFCATRMAQGISQGIVVPSIHTMLGRWVPPVERGRASTSVYSGSSFGTVAVMAGVGWLSSTPLGWPAGFYVPGGLAVLWGVAWLFLGAESPARCKAISWEEREYIEQSLGSASSGEQKHKVPLRSILTSIPFLSLVVVHCCNSFGHWLMLTQMPNYMKDVLQFDIKQNGLFSALPYLCLLIASSVVGFISQFVNERKILSLGASRKVFNSIAHYGSGMTLLVLALCHVSTAMAVLLLTVAVGLESCALAGFFVNHVDLSPNFAGTLVGLTSGVSNSMAIVAPIFVSAVVGDTKTATHEDIAAGWKKVFITAACIFFVGNSTFILGGKGEVQSWNSPETPPKRKDDSGALATELVPVLGDKKVEPC